jgi:transposase
MTDIAQLLARIERLEQENAVLRAENQWLKKKLFGGGQGEKLDQAQLALALGELAKVAAPPVPPTAISYERAALRSETRTVPAATFAHLPVQETILIEPPEVLAEPAAFERIGEERTFEIDVVPPKLFKREIVRPKYQRTAVPTAAPVVAAALARPVPGGYASAGLVAWIVVSKYQCHLPLYRLEQMSAHWGVTLPRQSMVEWVRLAAEWLQPIVRLMRKNLLAGGYVQADETPVRWHNPQEKRGKTGQGYFWGLSRPEDHVVFEWRLTRQHGEADKLLGEDYEGVLQSDGYQCYASYAAAHPAVVGVGCWAHARRNFFEAIEEAPQRATFILRLLGQLWGWERQWRTGRIGAALRSAWRHSHFALPLKLLKRLAERLQKLVLPNSRLGQACSYLLNQWEPLTAHLDHGCTELDNNAMENAIRPTALGKKNWMFIGHPDAGERSAVIYSIIVSCRRFGKDPFLYLRDVLAKLPTMTTKDDLTPLLPGNWQPA